MTNGQTDESDFTGRCPTNVERPTDVDRLAAQTLFLYFFEIVLLWQQEITLQWFTIQKTCNCLPPLWLNTSRIIAPLWIRPRWTARMLIIPSPGEFYPVYFSSKNLNMTSKSHSWLHLFSFCHDKISLYDQLIFLALVTTYFMEHSI